MKSIAVSDPDTSSLQTNIGVDLVAVRYPQAGILWDATKNLSFGITYRHSFKLELDQGFQINGNVGDPGLPPVIENGSFAARSRSMDNFSRGSSPAASRRGCGGAAVSFDLTYAAWERVSLPASRPRPHASTSGRCSRPRS